MLECPSICHLYTSMQPPLFDNILSCGSWVKDILDHNNNCKKVIIVGASDKLIQAGPKGYERQVRFYSETTLMHEEGWQNFSSGHINGPVYISIDKNKKNTREIMKTKDTERQGLPSCSSLAPVSYTHLVQRKTPATFSPAPPVWHGNTPST